MGFWCKLKIDNISFYALDKDDQDQDTLEKEVLQYVEYHRLRKLRSTKKRKQDGNCSDY